MYNPWIGYGLLTGSAYLSQQTSQDIASGEQSFDPRHWTLEQWKTSVLAGGLGYLGTVHSLPYGSYSTRMAIQGSALRIAVPLYGAYVVHDTVMNPGSDYYIPPDAPLLGRWQYGSEDVGSRFITALTDDLVGLIT